MHWVVAALCLLSALAAVSASSASDAVYECSKLQVPQKSLLFPPRANASGSAVVNNYQYFYFSAPAGTLVTITLDSSIGNADLFVSRSSKTLYPTVTNYEQASTFYFSSDVVRMKATTDTCFSIGVLGLSTSLTIFNLDITAKPLESYCIVQYPLFANSSNTWDYVNGFSGSVLRKQWQYFYVSVDSATPIRISLVNSIGDSDLYIADASRYPQPTEYKYTSRSTRRGSLADYVDLSPAGTTCYSIGVYGYAFNSSFSLAIVEVTRTTPAPTYFPTTSTLPSPTASYYSKCGRLYSGQGLEMYQDYFRVDSSVTYGTYKYYYFSASSGYTVTITLTSTIGNADLYVSNSETTFKPTKYNFESSSNNYYSEYDSVSISTSDEECIAIAIYGAASGSSNSFTLSVDETYNYPYYTSPPSPSEDNNLALYLTLGILLPILFCCAIPVCLIWLSAPRAAPAGRVQAINHVAVAQQRAAPAVPLLQDPEITVEGEFAPEEAGVDMDNIPPPAYL